MGIVSVCGGAGTCGRCRVQVLEGQVSAPTADEIRVLGSAVVNSGMRLACQSRILGDVRLFVPPDSLGTSQRLQLEGQKLEVELDPAVRAVAVRVPPATLGDLRSDAARLRDALREATGAHGVAFDLAALRELPAPLREQGWHGTLHVRQTEVVRFGPPGEAPLGLAVDLGTTKIAAHLMDLASGLAVGAEGEMNPQIAFGEDVMSRIAYAMRGDGQAGELQGAAAASLDALAEGLCHMAGLSRAQIVEAVVVGNTAMHHLFLGLPVSQLGSAPYVPAESAALDVLARDVGLHFAPGCRVHLLPNIAGFVGADHVAMLLGTGIPDMEGTVLGLDIGTNTELVLKARGRLISCSTASGPAFEGAHIRDGMRASAGAIESVDIKDGRVLWQAIGGVRPTGICGSGVLDAVAAMKRTGTLDGVGRMQPGPHVQSGKEGTEFVVARAAETGHGRDIAITRKDVSAIQLAKGAIRAGIELLMAEVGVLPEELDRVILAGAFGTYLSVPSILEIGMLPPVRPEQVAQVGNAAGVGARMALLSVTQRHKAAELARRAEYLELTALPQFSDVFYRAIQLG